MNAAPFARLEARLGRAVTARLANGWLVPEGGVAVAAVISRTAIDAVIGSGGMQARQVIATVPVEDLSDDVQRGSRLTLFRGAQQQLAEGEYLVRHRDDDVDPGHARLDLELAAA